MKTSKHNTALLLAVNSGEAPLVEFLVNKGNKLYLLHFYLVLFHLQKRTHAKFSVYFSVVAAAYGASPKREPLGMITAVMSFLSSKLSHQSAEGNIKHLLWRCKKIN